MDIPQRSFKCDETPTPTRFIRNCEEVGLFQDLQNNPFEETFRIAVQTKHTTQTLPEPLSKCASADTLDTPQVVPNSKRIEDYQISYPIIEDDEDEIKLSNNDYLLTRYMVDDENSLSKDEETPLESMPLVENFQSNIDHNTEQVSKQVNEPEQDIINLSESPLPEQISNLEPQSVQNEVIEEIFLDRSDILSDTSITNEFLILHNKNDSKENSYSSMQHRNENNMTIASNNITTIDSSLIKIHPKPTKPTESSVKQKLKKLLKPTENDVSESIPIIVHDLTTPTLTNPPTREIDDDKLSYSRERNRIAQKRCRQKKKKWITQLKQDTESVCNENKNLRAEVVSLKAEVARLKTLLLAHKNCPVTLAMVQANLSNTAQKDPSIPQISTLSSNVAEAPIPYAIISATGPPSIQIIESKTNQNKKFRLVSKKVPIPQVNPVQITNGSSKSHNMERKQSLKVIIDKNHVLNNSKPGVNSPNAVNVICYNQNQNITEITDLTLDSS